ncbi:MAG: Flp pilus assembly complex ATPase component TadA [Verrucomicrobiales bacterium]|nr:Flp pilus assembly complex ATPase component TadA [Verrucomicrobiales bacterium]
MNPPDDSKREVGDVLFAAGKLDADQLELVRRRQKRLRTPQHHALVELGFASEADTYAALAGLHGLEFVDLCHFTFPAGLPDEKRFPAAVIHNHKVLPLTLDDASITVAFTEPPRQAELGNLRLLLNRQVKPVLTTPSCYHNAVRQHFGIGAEAIQRLGEDREGNDASPDIVFQVGASENDAAVTAGIARYVDLLLADALRLQATDIHIEPYAGRVKLRYRVDGVMQPITTPDSLRQVYGALVSRLKIMAGLDIAEKRLPHDGRITMKTDAAAYDLRVSIIPTKHGEAVCLRILGRHTLLLDLRELGLEPDQEQLLRSLTRLPQGLVLLTGPTGSGKTTTLYATLANANDEGRKTLTIEDPVEYQLEGIVQIQTKEEIGLDFAAGLRAILRHDPDVVLIGEIRDRETADIAVRAAQTGHLVFSTLHANDSVNVITRLLDMGIDPFPVGAALVCSMAQRLAQRVCRHCAEPDDALSDELRNEMAHALRLAPDAVHARRGRGCVECNGKGTRGRVAIYEFFVMSEAVADLFGPDLTTGVLRSAARQHGWRSLRDLAWKKVQQGLIPATEVQRLTYRIRQPDAQPLLALVP